MTAAASDQDKRSKRGKGRKSGRRPAAGPRAGAVVSGARSKNRHTIPTLNATNSKRRTRNFLPLLPRPTSLTWVTSFSPAGYSPPYLMFGFSFAAGGSSSSSASVVPLAWTAVPAVAGSTGMSSLRLGSAVARPRQEKDSPCGLFGAFGVSLMMPTSGVPTPVVDDGLQPSCVTVMVDNE